MSHSYHEIPPVLKEFTSNYCHFIYRLKNKQAVGLTARLSNINQNKTGYIKNRD
jgi:hypothetical protein